MFLIFFSPYLPPRDVFQEWTIPDALIWLKEQTCRFIADSPGASSVWEFGKNSPFPGISSPDVIIKCVRDVKENGDTVMLLGTPLLLIERLNHIRAQSSDFMADFSYVKPKKFCMWAKEDAIVTDQLSDLVSLLGGEFGGLHIVDVALTNILELSKIGAATEADAVAACAADAEEAADAHMVSKLTPKLLMKTLASSEVWREWNDVAVKVRALYVTNMCTYIHFSILIYMCVCVFEGQRIDNAEREKKHTHTNANGISFSL